ncbi:hypothetical protein OG21DRAFT_1053529 [Imleria badia]|nr:hypothetical protein OG21DRAFT_1053529 [Imleria badia]
MSMYVAARNSCTGPGVPGPPKDIQRSLVSLLTLLCHLEPIVSLVFWTFASPRLMRSRCLCVGRDCSLFHAHIPPHGEPVVLRPPLDGLHKSMESMIKFSESCNKTCHFPEKKKSECSDRLQHGRI